MCCENEVFLEMQCNELTSWIKKMWSLTAFFTALAIRKAPSIMAIHILYVAGLEDGKHTPSSRLELSAWSYPNQFLYIFNFFFHSEDSDYNGFVSWHFSTTTLKQNWKTYTERSSTHIYVYVWESYSFSCLCSLQSGWTSLVQVARNSLFRHTDSL